jgi:phenylalanyl-tRNA synthetase beta subunit
LNFFDIYFDEAQPTSVNIGLRIEFQSKTETLVTETIENEMTKIKNSLISEFCAHEIRLILEKQRKYDKTEKSL